jgi:hypothetical protein
MKLNKTTLAVAMTLGFVGAASAACTPGTSTAIYVTGSTAFRAATLNAIESCLSNFTYEAYSESSTPPAGLTAHQTAGVVNYYGQLTNDGTCVIIKCAFSGSEAGYADLKGCGGTKTETFQVTPVSFPLANTDSTAAAPNKTDTHTVDIAMADNTQPFAQFLSRTPVLANTCIAGIIPFKWVKNAQTAADIAANPVYNRLVNVTHAQLRTCILNGSKSALFTGNSADTDWVYVAGRDNQSGTRANCLLDLGFSVSTAVAQTIIGGSDGAPTLGALGNGGQSSGGTLANTMKFHGSLSTADTINVGNPGWMAIAYLGAADAGAAEAGGAVELTLDGVAESDAAIQEGQYSYFGYEVCALSSCHTTSDTAGDLWTCLCAKWTQPSGIINAGYEIHIASMNAIKGSFPSTIVDSADPIHK